MGEIVKLLEVVYDPDDPEAFDGNVEVQEYGTYTAGMWTQPFYPLYMRNASKERILLMKDKPVPQNARPIITTIWAESIVLHGSADTILTKGQRISAATKSSLLNKD